MTPAQPALSAPHARRARLYRARLDDAFRRGEPTAVCNALRERWRAHLTAARAAALGLGVVA